MHEKNILKDTINPLEMFVKKRQFFNQNKQLLITSYTIK